MGCCRSFLQRCGSTTSRNLDLVPCNNSCGAIRREGRDAWRQNPHLCLRSPPHAPLPGSCRAAIPCAAAGGHQPVVDIYQSAAAGAQSPPGHAQSDECGGFARLRHSPLPPRRPEHGPDGGGSWLMVALEGLRGVPEQSPVDDRALYSVSKQCPSPRAASLPARGQALVE
jgi:hypothetical protein